MRIRSLIVLISVLLMVGCAMQAPEPLAPPETLIPAAPLEPKVVETQVAIPVPVPPPPLPEEDFVDLEALASEASAPPARPAVVIDQALQAARRFPLHDQFDQGIHIYPYADGGVYMVYCAPGRITSLLFEPGEGIIQYAGGDPSVWKVTEVASGAGGKPPGRSCW